MIYGSICSGVAPQTAAWSELGLSPAWFAEIEAFPSAVLQYHFPEVPNLGDFTRIGVDAVLDHAHEQREGLRSESGRSGAAGDDITSRRGAGRRLRCGGAEVRPEEIQRGSIDLLVGGTPCQSFSVAGKRAGLDDARGNLTIEFARLAGRLRPRWLVWENVPGVLSIDGGRTFGAFLGILGKLGYGFAYRILDAQHFGVPQRRRRVFVVGCLGNWRAAAAVLFERHSLSGNPPPRREKGEGITHDLAPCIGASDRGFERTGDTRGQDAVVATAPTIRAGGNKTGGDRPPGTDVDTCDSLIVAHSLRADGEAGARTGKSGKQHAIAFSAKDHGADAMDDCSPTLRARGFDKSHANSGNWAAVAIRTAQTSANGHGIAEDVSHTLDGAQGQAVAFQEAQTGVREYAEAGSLRANGPGHDPVGTRIREGMAVRRLTPREAERLQGFSDDFTRIPWRGKPAEDCPDGPRYKAIGNSWAVPCLRWIAERLVLVDRLLRAEEVL